MFMRSRQGESRAADRGRAMHVGQALLRAAVGRVVINQQHGIMGTNRKTTVPVPVPNKRVGGTKVDKVRRRRRPCHACHFFFFSVFQVLFFPLSLKQSLTHAVPASFIGS